MAEGRILKDVETGFEAKGAAVGVYRKVSKNIKVGVGYEWGNVSSDLAELDYTAKGAFSTSLPHFKRSKRRALVHVRAFSNAVQAV